MIIRKSALLRNALYLVGGLLLIVLLFLLFGPISPVGAAEEPAGEACGDGVCDPTQENNDLCPSDCHCTDNGVVDPGEGCGCLDLLCEGEDLSSLCGAPCGYRGACPEGLTCHNEVCWNPAACGPDPVADEDAENCDPVFAECSGQPNVGWAVNPCTGKTFRVYAPDCK